MDGRQAEALGVAERAITAFLAGDVATLRELIDVDLEWTFLDPTAAVPTPATCRGRELLELAVGRWATMGLHTEVEALAARGERVMVVLHTPGLDAIRARDAADRNFHVLTVRDGRVAALRACVDRREACWRLGLPLPAGA